MDLSTFLDKFNKQNYGPNDSVIASTINHPLTGLQKLQQYLSSNMLTASQAPLIPNSNPSGAQASSLAGLNLAGLLQTGAMPFAPSGAGTLGTILHLYHGTPKINLPSILQHGLKSSSDGYEGPGIYFAKTFDYANSHGREAGAEPVVLRASVGALANKYGQYHYKDNPKGLLQGINDDFDEDALLTGVKYLPSDLLQVYGGGKYHSLYDYILKQGR
jgi:hypothetical protein